MAKASSKRSIVTGRTWLIRGGIAVAAGLVIGATSGVVGVRQLEPGRPGQPDSLQLMLDSLQMLRDADDPVQQRRAVDSADADQRAQRRADSTELANDPNAPLVPNVITLEEGAARAAIEAAGLTVGSIQFRAATAAVGVVLASTPVAGLKVRAGTAVNLVLSDGRTPPPSDSLETLAAIAALPLRP